MSIFGVVLVFFFIVTAVVILCSKASERRSARNVTDTFLSQEAKWAEHAPLPSSYAPMPPAKSSPGTFDDGASSYFDDRNPLRGAAAPYANTYSSSMASLSSFRAPTHTSPTGSPTHVDPASAAGQYASSFANVGANAPRYPGGIPRSGRSGARISPPIGESPLGRR